MNETLVRSVQVHTSEEVCGATGPGLCLGGML